MSREATHTEVELAALTADARSSGGLADATFEFHGYAWADLTLQSHYRIAMDDGRALDFTETFDFGGIRSVGPTPSRSSRGFDHVNHAVKTLAYLAGVSYYKALYPGRIVDRCGTLTPGLAELIQTLWREGLAEFAFVNGLPDRDRIAVCPTAPPVNAPPGTDHEAGRCLLPFGGGKDSLLALDALRAGGFDVVGLIVGPNPVAAAFAERHGLPYIGVHRTLDPLLFKLNAAGALNGHIPITAINGAAATIAATLLGIPAVVMANEFDASRGAERSNFNGTINHQYSKSAHWEGAWRAFVNAEIDPKLETFSLLRPFSEVGIARALIRSGRGVEDFVSCNRNFARGRDDAAPRWCGDCPKCRFVFLLFAPWIARSRLESAFGRNLLDDLAQLEGYRGLAGIAAKPFECVGSVESVRALLGALSQRGEWSSCPVLTAVCAKMAERAVSTPSLDMFLKRMPDHLVPQHFSSALAYVEDACTR